MNIWNTTTWTQVIFIAFMNHDWKISRTMINDKNIKFMSNLWKIIIKKLNIIMLILIVWHSQINDQFEKTNEIIEIVLWFHIMIFSNENWNEILSYLQARNNNVTHVFIDYAFNELIYDFKVNDNVDLLTNLSSKNYNRLRLIKREKTQIVMIFVNVMNKARYDLHHKTITSMIEVEFMIYLRLHQKYIISKLINKKLFNQRVDLFKIIEVVDKSKQIYRLKLSSIMKIHSIISITQLKSITLEANFYNRFVDRDFSSIEKTNSDFSRQWNEIDQTSVVVWNRTIAW